MVIFYKKWEKYNETQLTKNKIDLNIRKITNHPPSPGDVRNCTCILAACGMIGESHLPQDKAQMLEDRQAN